VFCLPKITPTEDANTIPIFPTTRDETLICVPSISMTHSAAGRYKWDHSGSVTSRRGAASAAGSQRRSQGGGFATAWRGAVGPQWRNGELPPFPIRPSPQMSSKNEMCYSTKTQTFSPTKHTLRLTRYSKNHLNPMISLAPSQFVHWSISSKMASHAICTNLKELPYITICGVQSVMKST